MIGCLECDLLGSCPLALKMGNRRIYEGEGCADGTGAPEYILRARTTAVTQFGLSGVEGLLHVRTYEIERRSDPVAVKIDLEGKTHEEVVTYLTAMDGRKRAFRLFHLRDFVIVNNIL